MFVPITDQELRVENSNDGSFATMVYILNQFEDTKPQKNSVIFKNTISIATSKKGKGWYFGK